MKNDKLTNPNLEPEQEIELTEDQLDEVGGGAAGGGGIGIFANDKDPFDKKKLTLNPNDLASNPAGMLPFIRNNTNQR